MWVLVFLATSSYRKMTGCRISLDHKQNKNETWRSNKETETGWGKLAAIMCVQNNAALSAAW